jgi:glyceraldehyde 3-phosphate dehydrogenase
VSKIRLFINGFGRIGRAAFKIAFEDDAIEIVGINDIYDFSQMAYLLKYDSIYGVYERDVKIESNSLLVDHKRIPLHSKKEPDELNLEGVDLFLDCSGIFLDRFSNETRLKMGAKKVLISTPVGEDIPTYVMDLNHKKYKGEKIISNSSCSANAILPIMKIIDSNYDLLSGTLTMYHSYTAYQKLLDVKHYSKDIRRSRSATQNIEPLQSSAAKECVKFFPKLKSSLTAISVRVPVCAVTLYEMNFKIKNSTSKDKLLKLLNEKIESYPYLKAISDPLVSRDFIKDENMAVVDLNMLDLIGDNLIRVSAWQDNEWGYAKQLIRMVKEIG